VKAFHRIALSALGLMLAPQAASASVLDELTPAERLLVDGGTPLVKSRDVAGSSWPSVFVYQTVNSTPEEAMAVFTDYGQQSSYLKSCCGVVVSRVLDPAVDGDLREQRVLYEIQVPVVSNERYELREGMSRGEDRSYRVVWAKVSTGGRSDAIVGRAVFEPYEGKTLFFYYNYTKITAAGAGLFAGESVKRTRETVTTMARRMEQESAAGGARLEANVARVRAALGR
jgi:hypothetical protein